MALQRSTFIHDDGGLVVYYVADTQVELPLTGLIEGWLAYAKDNDKFFKATSATTWTEVGAGGGGGGLSVTLVTGASGAANAAAAPSETRQILSANAAANATTTLATVMTTTGLAIGTYFYEFYVVWQSSLATVGVKFAVDYTGTVTRTRMTRHDQTTGAAAATGVADGLAATLTGQLVEHHSGRSDAAVLGPNTGVDTINADQFSVIRGILIVSTSANLLLQHASEAANSTQVMADTMLFLKRLA